MKWKIKPKPKIGDLLVTTNFAYLPVTIGNTRIWLEEYYSIDEFVYIKVEAGHYNDYDGIVQDQSYYCWREKALFLELKDAVIERANLLKKAQK